MLVLTLVGCGESPRQTAARLAVEARLPASRYDVDRTRCTGNPAPWFVEKNATVFVCAARRRAGGCDWYQARLGNIGWAVSLQRRNAGCLLPF